MSRFIGVARHIKDRATNEADKAVDGLELMFGEVTSKGIVTNRFKGKPINDYKVLEQFTFTDIMAKTSIAGEHAHSHNVITPKQFQRLRLGDIVVIAMVDGEFVVLGRVVIQDGK